uniref:CobQ/CobB/MinD/ParA nucleotide binding domain-containing protein n=1 Tax=Thermofilum pendens TaxID=2269 RepID=A0A7J3X7C4_THEPE
MRKLCVTSGCKGGVGKSTLACLLAYALSQEGFSVVLLDLGGGDSGTLCLGGTPSGRGLTGREHGYWEGLRESPLSSGLRVAYAAPSSSWEELHLEAIRDAEVAIVDTAPCSQHCKEALFDLRIFVALPNWLSWHAYRRWVEKPEDRTQGDSSLLVINMYHPLLGDWKRRYAVLARRVATLSYDPALAFIYTRDVAEAYLVLSGRTKRDLRDLLDAVKSLLQGAHNSDSRGGVSLPGR